jgi:hypothetical protein
MFVWQKLALHQRPRGNKGVLQLQKNTAGETRNRLLSFSIWVLLRSRFLCKTSDTMLSEAKIGAKSFWRRQRRS